MRARTASCNLLATRDRSTTYEFSARSSGEMNKYQKPLYPEWWPGRSYSTASGLDEARKQIMALLSLGESDPTHAAVLAHARLAIASLVRSRDKAIAA